MSDREVEFDRIGKDVLEIVQQESREWRRQAYPDTAGIMFQALGVAEEVGELCHAVLKYKQGIRGYDRAKAREEVADAIGDIVIYACGVADELEIDVRLAVARAWTHVKNRNITQGSDAGVDAEGFNKDGEWIQSEVDAEAIERHAETIQSAIMSMSAEEVQRHYGMQVDDGNVQNNNF
jgi:NTP pyrophosphatase (non-canonical NTP hydrolase)